MCAGTPHLNPVAVHEDSHALARAVIVAVNHRVDHRFTQRLIGVLRLVVTAEPADRGADTDVLPKKAARFIDQLGQGSDEVLAVGVGANPLCVSYLMQTTSLCAK